MIRINSFLHRQRVMDIVRRWFYGKLQPDDLLHLKELVNFNGVWLKRVLHDFSLWVLQQYHQTPIEMRKVSSKGELKDLMIRNPPYCTQRIKKLIQRYQNHPERYFLETPFGGTLYLGHNEGKQFYLGSSRIKRVRRIAEKGARRIIDFLFDRIQRKADAMAEERAEERGIPKSQLITSQEEMIHEFERAERRIGALIRQGTLFDPHVEFVLNDVAGIKIIVEDHRVPAFLQTLQECPDCRLLEVEPHRGRYNATNVAIRYRPNRERLLDTPISDEGVARLLARGMDPQTVRDNFRQFVLSGEEAVCIELIISNYQEALESEIGRSMHEDRIIRQRLQQEYRGPLARNVGYLMEYLFACAMSPRTTLDDLPIKVWNKYMPDYFDEVIKDLFQIPCFQEVE